MTVKELISELIDCDWNAEVVLEIPSEDMIYEPGLRLVPLANETIRVMILPKQSWTP